MVGRWQDLPSTPVPFIFRFSKIQISNFHFRLKVVYFWLILLPKYFAILIYFKALFSLF